MGVRWADFCIVLRPRLPLACGFNDAPLLVDILRVLIRYLSEHPLVVYASQSYRLFYHFYFTYFCWLERSRRTHCPRKIIQKPAPGFHIWTVDSWSEPLTAFPYIPPKFSVVQHLFPRVEIMQSDRLASIPTDFTALCWQFLSRRFVEIHQKRQNFPPRSLK